MEVAIKTITAVTATAAAAKAFSDEAVILAKVSNERKYMSRSLKQKDMRLICVFCSFITLAAICQQPGV